MSAFNVFTEKSFDAHGSMFVRSFASASPAARTKNNHYGADLRNGPPLYLHVCLTHA